MDKKRLDEITDNVVKSVLNEYFKQDAPTLFDLSKIPTEELKRKYVDYRLVSRFMPYGSDLMERDDSFIFEATNYSVPLNKVKEELSKKYGLAEWQFNIIEGENHIEIAILIAEIGTNSEIITGDMQEMGYFVGIEKNINANGMIWRQMQFEPKYQNQENNLIRSKKILFHITPGYNIPSLRKNGFIPQHKNKIFTYPNRVYFVKGDAKKYEIINLAKQLCSVNTDPKNDGVYFILTILLSKVADSVNFYLDPNYSYGVFTEDAFSYDCVINEEMIRLK